jgi:hypothetical protein
MLSVPGESDIPYQLFHPDRQQSKYIKKIFIPWPDGNRLELITGLIIVKERYKEALIIKKINSAEPGPNLNSFLLSLTRVLTLFC